MFNKVNYPNLVRLFDDLSVPYVESDMSFGASIDGGRVEYGLKSLDVLFAQRKNLVSPRFLGMLTDILRFNKHAASVATPDMTIRELLAALGTGAYFRDYYITPFSGAIWSTPTRRAAYTKSASPPTAASGPTWPMQKPRVAPEKRPSVMRATFSPMPRP